MRIIKISSPCWENREGRKGLLGDICGSWAVPHDYLPGMNSPTDFKRSSAHTCHWPQSCHQHLWLTESKASDRSKIRLAKHIIKDLGRSVNDLSSALLSQIQSAVGAHWSAKLGFQGLEINDPLDCWFFFNCLKVHIFRKFGSVLFTYFDSFEYKSVAFSHVGNSSPLFFFLSL